MANFTPQQIEEFLQEFFDVVGTRQYIGARYIPIFGRPGESSIEWDDTAPYEPLTIVLYQGDSYTSRQYVPAGIPITNGEYWAKTSNYNSQVEQYRQEVLQLSQTVDELSDEFHATQYMVVVGDSFSNNNQSGSPLWYTYVARQLGLTVYTNATDNRGFGPWLSSSYSFLDQIQMAAANLNADQVKLIYIVGGLNDTRNENYNNNDFYNGVSSVLDYAITHFPRARIELYGPTSFPQINSHTTDAAIYMSYACMLRGIEYHDLSGTFNLLPGFFGGNGGTASSATMHPSARGEQMMAHAIMNHGRILSPLYQPSQLPAQLLIPPILKQAWIYDLVDPSDPTAGKHYVQLADSVMSNEALYTNDGTHYIWSVTVSPTTIPTTAERLVLVPPMGYSWLKRYRTSNYMAGTISQLQDNKSWTGWIDASASTLNTFGEPALFFNINRSGGVTPITPGGTLRVEVEF